MCITVLRIIMYVHARIYGAAVAYPPHRHHVSGECAGLIGADDRSAAERLHGGKAADNGVLLGHPSGAESQTGGDDSWEALWNGGHCQRHCDLEVVHSSL